MMRTCTDMKIAYMYSCAEYAAHYCVVQKPHSLHIEATQRWSKVFQQL
jgi:hypothetical protein